MMEQVATNEIPALPDFKFLAENLDVERKTIVKVNNFAEDDDEYVRSLEDAKTVLDFIERFQTKLWNFLSENPSLVGLFNTEFVSLHDFLQRDNVLDLIFLDDCLMPEKEAFYYGQDGGISFDILSVHDKTIDYWIRTKGKNHTLASETIRDAFTIELKAKDLACECISCVAEYRTKLREFVFTDCLDQIEETKKGIEENMNNGVSSVAETFYNMQKELDKKFYKVRYRLKRSSLNRLESQIKGKTKDLFNYPADLAKEHSRNIRPLFDDYLLSQELSLDLITDQEYGRFFTQLATNIWRNERYLEKEFKKFVRSMVVLKKKDVSSKILNDYLGEFWVHSQARQIKRKIIYHMGPTNSGKTYHSIQALCEAKTGCYLAPLRLLAGELYDTMNQKGVKTSLLTGEEVVEVEGGTHYSSTIEMARFQEIFDCVVIDEIQMITDPSRGWAWTRALVSIFSPEIHVCGDASAYEMVKNIAELCGDELEVKEYTRMTELQVEPKPIRIGDLQKNDALIVFSRRNALRFKRDLEKLDFKVSIVYGRLSPEVRREQARKFDAGETDIMVSTDAIAMGMNLPIRRVVFSTITKYYNAQEHDITASEIKQIAGRAGRYQRFPVGYTTCLQRVDNGIENIQDALDSELPQSTQCMVGPDLDIFSQVNDALAENSLPGLKLSEFLRLFYTMTFKKPFHCVELKEMIELAEMVEEADREGNLTTSEIFGFACAPVNLGLLEHVQYYVWIMNHYVSADPIINEMINHNSSDIDYLETSIKCVELYQWLSRHFNYKNFEFSEEKLLENKGLAIEKLNTLLSAKIVPTCSSCGDKLDDKSKFAICEGCFAQRKTQRRSGRPSGPRSGARRGGSSSSNSGPSKRRAVSRKRKSAPKGKK